MALVLRAIARECIQLYQLDSRDRRNEHLFLNGTPTRPFLLIVVYLAFVKKIGPALMENRKPFELKTIMTIYNFIQVVVNFIMGTFAFSQTYGKHYSWTCQPCDFSNSKESQMDLLLTYIYYMIKVSDLMDTVFFVLRKKNSHITFLHVYHHIGMVFGGYLTSNFIPGGHATMLGVINCYVHCFMYFYLFLTSFKPELKKSMWWKKYITQIQMAQFAYLIVHFSLPIFISNCTYSIFWTTVSAIQNLFMFVLFLDFYIKAYIKKSPTKDHSS